VYQFIFDKPISQVKLFEMMELIQFFSHSTTLVSNSRYYYNKLKIQEKFKQKIDLFSETCHD
jgi:hypothetical protein